MDVLHVALAVEDLEATRGFYEGLLGLQKTDEVERSGVRNYYVGGTGPAEIQFRVVDEKPAPAGFLHVAIQVDDVDGVVETAVAEWDSEVEMEPRDTGDRRIAFVTDPEGYSVELIEEL